MTGGRWHRRGRRSRTLLLAAGLLAATACRTPEPAAEARRPLIVFGIDGAEWRVIEDLWAEGRLPTLRRLAEHGVRSHLLTAYTRSPVIWTTIATGRLPAAHGITDFVVDTPQGKVPVSSRLRRVPALWNMTARVALPTAVVGWWASWPAETISGVVISDRAAAEVAARVSPAGALPQLVADLATARSEANTFGGNPAAKLRDQLVAVSARRLAAERPWALMLVYFRGVDIASHNFWKYYQPEAFEGVDPAEVAAKGDWIPAVYDATDRAIGAVIAAAGGEANVLVVSDHGFLAAAREQTKVTLDFDRVLERLGYLGRDHAGAVDCRRSTLFTYGSSPGEKSKRLRFCRAGREPDGGVEAADEPALRARLEADLATVTFGGGEPAFFLRDPIPAQRRRGGDLEIVIQDQHATETLLIAGRPAPGLVDSLWTISGTHSAHTHGIFIAHGPDLDPAAEVDGISIHDLAPTILYGLGLPVADDFAGRPFTGLFAADFRARRPPRRIASWGTMDDWGVVTSPVDQALVDELRALGYL